MSIEIVSLDTWYTVVEPNPAFSLGRSQIIRHYLAPSLSFDAVDAVVRHIKHSMDKQPLSIPLGWWLELQDRIAAIYGLLPEESRVPIPNLKSVIKTVEEAILDLSRFSPPILVEQDLPEILAEIKSRGVKLALFCNTGFIDERQIQAGFEKLGIWHFFDYPIFSSLYHVLIPNRMIYEGLVARTHVQRDRVLYVGDNHEADVIAPMEAGFQTLHFTKHSDEGEIFSLWEILKYL